MVRGTAKGGVFSEMLKGNKDLRAAFEEHKGDPVTLSGGGGLPAGIEGGVAQLIECGFTKIKSEANKGKPRFAATGVVVEPAELRGLHTRIGVNIFTDQYSTEQDKLGRALNELKKLGIDPEDMTSAEVEAAIADVVAEQPYFRFRTWKTPDSDRVIEDWRGIIEGYEAGGVEPVTDESEEGYAEAESEDSEETDENENEGDEEDGGQDGGEAGLIEVGQSADQGDGDAIDQLTEMAEQHDIDPDEYDTWEELAVVLRAAEASDGEADEDDDPDGSWEPAVDDVYVVKLKGMRKAIECEVTAVFPRKRTVNLKAMDSEKAYKGISWDALDAG